MTEQLTEEHAPVEAPAAPIRVSWATTPKVNLLPLEIVQKRRFRRVQQMLGALVVAGLVVAGAGVYLAQRSVSNAQDELTTAQSQVTTLQAEASKYSAVPEAIAEVEAATTARSTVMASDVLWYQFMNDLQGALPSGVTQSGITVTLTPTTAAATTGTAVADPLAAAGVGTLTVTGDADQFSEISAWLDNLAKITGVSSPGLTNATKAEDAGSGTVTYNISAVITDAAFSNRYDDKEGS